MSAVSVLSGLPARAAYLDLVEPGLDAVGRSLRAAGHTSAVVVPLLFTEAFHARVDVPRAIRGAGESSGMTLDQAAILGTGDDVAQLVLRVLDEAGVGRDIPVLLVAVGSSRPGADGAVADLARRLGDVREGAVRAAFCTREPRAAQALEMASGPLAVCPLFLADGLLLDPLRAQAALRGATFVEPLAERAAPLVVARYRAAQRPFRAASVGSLG